MKVALLTRGVPNKYDPQEGCFEWDQAHALMEVGITPVVVYVDARLRRNRHQWGITHNVINGIETYKIYWGTITIIEHLLSSKLAEKIYSALTSKILKKVFKDHPDICLVHAHYLTLMHNALRFHNTYGIPLIGTEHWSEIVKDNASGRIVAMAERTYRNLDQLISVSDYLRNCILEKYNVDSVVCPNVLSQEFNATDIKQDNSDSKRFSFVSCGSLIPRKGYDILIDAASKLNIPKENWNLTIIGSGPEKRRLECMIAEKGLQNNIFLVGRLSKSEIVETLHKSDCFVLSSRSETFGVVVIEALSAGLPCVVTRCGGTDGLINEKSGLYVPVDDAEAMMHSMKHIYNHSASYNKAEIRRDCLSKYSAIAVGTRLKEIYINTIKRKSNS